MCIYTYMYIHTYIYAYREIERDREREREKQIYSSPTLKLRGAGGSPGDDQDGAL